MHFFAAGQPGYYLLILLFVACIALLLYFNARRRQKSVGPVDQLQEKYAVMTRELLDNTPDNALVAAVIANLMAKLKMQSPNPLITMPQQTRGRCAVYFAWLLCQEIDANGFAALHKNPTARFTAIGIDSLEAIGADNCAAAVRTFVEQTETDSDPAADFAAAVQAENPLALCCAYIRREPDDFVDDAPAD